MGAGLQVWDASGQLIFDTPDRCGRVVGTLTTSGSGSVTIPVPAGCTPFWFSSPTDGATFTTAPAISISGNVLSWVGGSPTTIYYGYY